MSEITKAAFQALEGDDFEIHFDNDEIIRITLAEVISKEHLDSDDVENFALLFTGPLDKQLMQASFPLRHDAIGIHQIFLVPIGPKDDLMQYEAVFSRKKEQPA